MQSFIRLLAAGAVAALPTAASAVVVDFEEVVFPTSDLFIPFQTQPYTENGFTFTVLSNHYDFIGGGDTAIQLDSLALDSSNFNALTSIEITSAGGAFSLASMFVATSFRENTGTTDFTELLDPGIFRIEADVTGGGSETGNFTASLNTLETFDDAFNDITALRLVQNVPGQLRISEFTFGDPVTSGGMDGGGDTPGGGMPGGGMPGGGMTGGGGTAGGGMGGTGDGGGMGGGMAGDMKDTVAPVPLPASALFLIAGLGGLSLVRARKR